MNKRAIYRYRSTDESVHDLVNLLQKLNIAFDIYIHGGNGCSMCGYHSVGCWNC